MACCVPCVSKGVLVKTVYAHKVVSSNDLTYSPQIGEEIASSNGFYRRHQVKSYLIRLF